MVSVLFTCNHRFWGRVKHFPTDCCCEGTPLAYGEGDAFGGVPAIALTQYDVAALDSDVDGAEAFKSSHAKFLSKSYQGISLSSLPAPHTLTE